MKPMIKLLSLTTYSISLLISIKRNITKSLCLITLLILFCINNAWGSINISDSKKLSSNYFYVGSGYHDISCGRSYRVEIDGTIVAYSNTQTAGNWKNINFTPFCDGIKHCISVYELNTHGEGIFKEACYFISTDDFIGVDSIDGIFYSVDEDEGEATVIGSIKNIETVSILQSYLYNQKEYPVTKINEAAFCDRPNLKEVFIPTSIKSVGSYAFSYCNNLIKGAYPSELEDPFYIKANISYPMDYSIDNHGVIYDKEKTKVYFAPLALDDSYKIPSTIKDIHEYSFYGCSSLTSIEIPNSVTSIEESAFGDCSSLTSIEISNSVTRIGNYAFSDCESLHSLTIGSGVLFIGSNAFATPKKVIWLTNTPPSGYTNAKGTINYVSNEQYTSLSNKTIYPFLSSMFEVGGVKYVPVSPSERTCDVIDCLYNESAENIDINNSVENMGVSLTVQNMNPYSFYGNKFIKNVKIDFDSNVSKYAFYGCTALKTVEIANKGNIGDRAFYGCTALKTVEIANKGDIDDYAFYGCTALETVEINNTGNIGDNAFSYSEITQTLNVNNTGNIGTSAFANIAGNYTANINNMGAINGSAFKNSTGLTSLNIGGNVTNIGSDAFYGCTGLKNIQLNNHGTIGANAYQNCSALETVTLGERITYLGDNVFRGCSMLQNIVVTDSVQSLGSYAFSGCESLKSAKIGKGIREIEKSTFSDCSALTDIQIGNNVGTIGSSAFNNCSALTNIIIPKSVTKISDYVFGGCSTLQKIVMENEASELHLGSNGSSPLFADCPLDSVYIGRNISYSTSSSSGYSPFYRNTSLTTVTITDEETEIPANEFYGCTNLKNVTIGNNVTSIGDWAFSGCSSLDSFEFGYSVDSIGKEAFSDCTAMTKITSHAITPPICGANALDDINKWACTLSVPQGYAAIYQQADQWKDFFFVNDDVEIATGIENIIATDTDDVIVYTMNGLKQTMKKDELKSLPKGIYIVNGKKVMIK